MYPTSSYTCWNQVKNYAFVRGVHSWLDEYSQKCDGSSDYFNSVCFMLFDFQTPPVWCGLFKEKKCCVVKLGSLSIAWDSHLAVKFIILNKSRSSDSLFKLDYSSWIEFEILRRKTIISRAVNLHHYCKMGLRFSVLYKMKRPWKTMICSCYV